MKAMTPAERIASVDPDIREELIEKNQSGVGMKHLATAYRISEATVRAIIHDSKLTDRPRMTFVPRQCQVWDAEISPGWHCHGTLTAEQARRIPG